MKRAALGAILVIAIAIAAVLGVYAATPTKPEDTGTGTTPISPSLGVCAPDTPDCVDTAVTTTSGGEE